MDKATLTKKSVLALERMAKKVGAKTVTPDGKKKNKTQLVNSIIIAERLGKKNPALKAKKAPAKKAPAKKVVAKKTTAKKVVRKPAVKKTTTRKRPLLAANNVEWSRVELMEYLTTKAKLKHVRPGEEYADRFRGEIWVAGDNQEKFRGSRALFYYNKSTKYLNGVIKPLAEKIINSGWAYYWLDPATLFIYKK